MIDIYNIGIQYLGINLGIILTLLYLAYDDWKTRYVDLEVVGLLFVLGIISMFISYSNNLFTFNDLVVIGIVILTTGILILSKQMAVGDAGVIPVAIAMPYITGLSLLFFSLFVFISYFKGIKTQPFYTLFVVGVLIATLYTINPLGIMNPHVCEQLEYNTLNFSEGYCINPFIIIQYEEQDPYMKDFTNITFGDVN